GHDRARRHRQRRYVGHRNRRRYVRNRNRRHGDDDAGCWLGEAAHADAARGWRGCWLVRRTDEHAGDAEREHRRAGARLDEVMRARAVLAALAACALVGCKDKQEAAPAPSAKPGARAARERPSLPGETTRIPPP